MPEPPAAPASPLAPFALATHPAASANGQRKSSPAVSSSAGNANPFKDTITSPLPGSMRDTMPMPAGLAEQLHSPGSAATRPTGPGTVPITRPRTVIPAHSGSLNGLAFSADGRLLASAGSDSRVRLWDVTGLSPKELATFPRPGAEFHSVVFAPHDHFLAVGGVVQSTARVWRWDCKEGRVAEWGAYQGEKVTVSSLAFSRDGKRFAAGIGAFVVSWKINGRSASTGEILKGHGGPVRAVTWSPDGKRAASVGESHSIIFWGFGWLGASQKARVAAHTNILLALSYSPDGSKIAVGGNDKQVVVWDANNPKEQTTSSLVGHMDSIRLVKFLPDESLLTIGNNGQVFVWDVAPAIPMSEYQLNERITAAVAVSADGRRIATGTSDGKLALYDIAKVSAAVTVG
jgi:WD40 repeat protein